MKNNFYITRAIGWVKAVNAKPERVYERISQTIASMIIGRGANQSLDDYLSAKPELKEYYEWWMEHKDKLNELIPDRVKFYVEPDGGIMAYFPDLPYAHTGEGRVCYSHIGQHSGCDPDYLHRCKVATPEQYKDLAEELTSIEYVLNII